MSLSRRSRSATPETPAWDAVGRVTMSIVVSAVELTLAALVGAVIALYLTSSPDQPRLSSNDVVILTFCCACGLGFARWVQARYGASPALTKKDLREVLAERTPAIEPPSSGRGPKGGARQPQPMVWTQWDRS